MSSTNGIGETTESCLTKIVVRVIELGYRGYDPIQKTVSLYFSVPVPR